MIIFTPPACAWKDKIEKANVKAVRIKYLYLVCVERIALLQIRMITVFGNYTTKVVAIICGLII
jgi:hypothetical protein